MARPIDNELYPPWRPEDLPPSVKGSLADLPKFEKEQWQPKEGEWIVNLINRPNNRPRLIEKHPIKTRCIVNDEDLKLEEVAVLFRPARLSDFAIKIPDYGKVWFVGIGNCIDIIGDDKDHCHEMSFYKYAPIKVWITTGLIDHYNIPVMPEELFKKLSEGK